MNKIYILEQKKIDLKIQNKKQKYEKINSSSKVYII